MNIITVRYWGGMGNVLFEIASAIAHSNRLNRPFLLAKYPAFPKLDNHTPSSIGLDETEFANTLKEFSEEEIARGEPFPENQPVKLIGFYQVYTLFDEYKDQIFHIIGIPDIRKNVLPIIHSTAFQSRGLFGSVPTISLHIRRGDYEGLSCEFLLLNQYYYKLALLNIIQRLLPQNIAKFNILCFYEKKSFESANKVIDALLSDNDLSTYPIEFYHFNSTLDEMGKTATDIEEMAIMSQCNHHIIANSTYSWWSAYINPDPNKIVCYPNEYFNHQLSYLSNDGLKVEGWTSIEAWNPNEYRCNCYLQIT
jgi:hypothetical protein